MWQLDLYDRNPISRRTDPVQSHEAAAAVELGPKQQACLEVLANSEMTANEIGRKAAVQFGGIAESYRKRLGELVDLGAVIECGLRACAVTGKRAMTFKKA